MTDIEKGSVYITYKINESVNLPSQLYHRNVFNSYVALYITIYDPFIYLFTIKETRKNVLKNWYVTVSSKNTTID